MWTRRPRGPATRRPSGTLPLNGGAPERLPVVSSNRGRTFSAARPAAPLVLLLPDLVLGVRGGRPGVEPLEERSLAGRDRLPVFLFHGVDQRVARHGQEPCRGTSRGRGRIRAGRPPSPRPGAPAARRPTRRRPAVPAVREPIDQRSIKRHEFVPCRPVAGIPDPQQQARSGRSGVVGRHGLLILDYNRGRDSFQIMPVFGDGGQPRAASWPVHPLTGRRDGSGE